MKKILDKKINLGVIFGGMSTENEVSCISGVAVINNLNKDKYNIKPIYIDKSGNWYILKDLQQNAKLGNELDNREQIENVIEFLKGLDVVFPVLHGMYGEDGTIQIVVLLNLKLLFHIHVLLNILLFYHIIHLLGL